MVGPVVVAPDLGVEPAAQRAVGRGDPRDRDALDTRRPGRPQPGGIVELEIGPHDGLGHLGYLADRAARGSCGRLPARLRPRGQRAAGRRPARLAGLAARLPRTGRPARRSRSISSCPTCAASASPTATRRRPEAYAAAGAGGERTRPHRRAEPRPPRARRLRRRQPRRAGGGARAPRRAARARHLAAAARRRRPRARRRRPARVLVPALPSAGARDRARRRPARRRRVLSAPLLGALERPGVVAAPGRTAGARRPLCAPRRLRREHRVVPRGRRDDRQPRWASARRRRRTAWPSRPRSCGRRRTRSSPRRGRTAWGSSSPTRELRVLDGVGHFVPLQAPDEVAGAIRAATGTSA